ncbi:MAG: energy-coupling factor transporter transmembrane component T [Chloroflexota bacterium]|nr:hypothetical protein [Anaerolineales bacterium]MCB8965911.1 hypothetical protein [Ardenticatenaceae bacterium]
MNAHSKALTNLGRKGSFEIGPVGHLVLFFWALGMVMLTPPERLVWAGSICLVVAAIFYPNSFRGLLRLRYLLMMTMLMLPTVFFLGEIDRQLWRIGYSSAGVLAAIQIGLRFVVVLTAVNGFTSTVDIPQVGGLLERFGLRGLGFSLGVALNLLPGLQQSSHNAWQALQMRGGLRRRWWRGLRLLAMTVMTNALRRAEEIALAAESRAFSPECVRPMPLRSGWQDKLLFPVGLFVLLWMALG